MSTEPHDIRLKRMYMRATHRGIKEMDIILGNFATDRLAAFDTAGLDLFDALLEENDQDLYQWVTGQAPTPAPFGDLIETIAVHAGAR
ncbi:MAG: succinate dehydrogenase assembly factor 2 [Rhodovulum sp.]|jgi:antitoxin CptB|uniref:FAD assembly factor SdhE n=1 Tax=Rhodovulum sp. FJ3 TaxID=3079053 RepID=UPI000C097E27|nr:succinate dehydrogenase assembly factor 2 [Rhodovulum sp. FJ3]MAY32859.1 succinate dehydrogenase assembly factor 2 [Rhodovulum sp.]MEC8629940.1 succinate dehydrogenase assembly factor 2 [Pseudomonadota bacterium]MCI5086541.1 succinate dehydrogenase assembly factor 2 [Rhodovulum sp.]MDV4166985.1 succinate dehydrogenase assembly factor 2 [Rhodovulum sp. FJ3]MEC8796647.1 succinate dehydrogenase assembly factor 2 [Pseudomonadota bacterium]|tara:strand:+ start:194 stop:457 length:264 start_codon:yes stop_codon:yes gene_type:complete